MDQFNHKKDKSCVGRNELGKWWGRDALGCAQKCLDLGCKSFDHNPKEKLCYLSTTCDSSKSRGHKGHNLWERKTPYTSKAYINKYTWTDNMACADRNELGEIKPAQKMRGGIRMCAITCGHRPQCKSFEYNKDSELCQFSTTCTPGISTSHPGWTLYTKIPGQTVLDFVGRKDYTVI